MAGKIGTHNGKFHCDEAFACFMLKQLSAFKDFSIVRTRDPAQLKECDVVVDVGGVYDHNNKRYDHHQKEFVHNMKSIEVLDFSTKLSSAGLIYAHYGKQLISEILNEKGPIVDILYKKLYETFVEQIDAVDNGIPQYDGVARYQSSGGISGRVGHLNPHWNEEGLDPDERFQKAMQLVGGEFVEALQYLYKVWWPARKIVEEAIDNRQKADPSGRIVVFENGSVPWKEHFFMIEEEKNLKDAKMTYVVFGDSTSSGWRVQAIPTDKMASFENRLPLPEAWRSLRDEELSKISGIPNCVFVHTSGFIGGNKTREGALEMARRALEIIPETEAKKPKLDV